jgi:hypothetical protein
VERGGGGAAAEHGLYDGLELRTFGWSVLPLAVEAFESSYFEDGRRFPGDLIEFDSC